MRVLKCVFGIFFVLALASCGGAYTTAMPTSTATLTPTATPLPPTPTPTFTPTPAPTSTPTPVPPELAGLRMAYTAEKNLYLQDGGNRPIQLTEYGKGAFSPVIADDGEKIVFLRGSIPKDLYSINADGSREQLLVSGKILSQLDLGYDELSEIRLFAFIPGTHQVVFNVRELDEGDIRMGNFNRPSAVNFDDLLIVDADTGEIRRILAPGQGGDFVIAPTGELIAVQRRAHIDLVDIEGKTLWQNMLIYVPTQPYELKPVMVWADDASALVVTLPIEAEYNRDGPEFRAVWRIPMDGSAKTRSSFDPPVLASDYTISPDGNWILYQYYYYPGKTSESNNGIYLGNLLDGSSQLFSEIGPFIGPWNPDSHNFLYETGAGWFLGTTDGQSDPIAINDLVFAWIDDRHFLFYSYGDDGVSIGSIDETIIPIPISSSVYISTTTFAFVYTESEP